VAHGPLVLQDAMFENMDLETMETVLESKVKGSINLEAYFGDRQLEFFVYFSSLVAAGGNRGQSNYAAANLYLSSAAARRRKHGLAASCINISAVTGVGFIARAARESDYAISKIMFMPVSEQDLHQQFAEAVLAGNPSSKDSFEITTGMPFNDPAHREHIPFIDDPRLGFYKLPERTNVFAKESSLGGPVKDRLASAGTREDAERIIREATLEKLRIALQLPADDSIDSEVALIDQGVDSLVAVTLRSWFSKELGIDVPVLKVLGGASVADLASNAFDKLSPDTMPQMQLADDSTETDLVDPGETETSSSSLSSVTADTSDNSDSDEILETPFTVFSPCEDGKGPIGFFDDTLTPADLGDAAKTGEDAHDLTAVRAAPMSFGQARFWLVRNLVQDQTASNVTIGMWVDGPLDFARLSKAVNKFTNRHETFRTRFLEQTDEKHRPTPMQAVMARSKVTLEICECSDRSAALDGFQNLQRHIYDLENGSTSRMVLFTWGPTEHFFVIAYHHIIMDGWGFEMMVKELDALYNNKDMSPVQQYLDFSARQRLELEDGAMSAEKAYWHAELSPPPQTLPLLPFSTSPSRTATLSWDFYEESIRLDPLVAARIRDRSRKQKANPFHFYLAAYYVMLARMTDTDDICIGLADANRTGLDDIRTMGFFINLLPIRLTYDPSETFGDAIIRARDKSRQALQNSKLPFDVMLEQLGVTGTATHSPVFQVFLDYKQGQSESGKIGPSTISGVEMSRGRTGYDISIEITEDPTKDPLINIKLQKNLYAQTDVAALLKSFVNILQTFSRNPAVRIDEPRLFAKADISKALVLGRGPNKVFPEHTNLLQQIEEHCDAFPDRLALSGQAGEMTYRKLQQRVFGIAGKLTKLGIAPRDRVGVMQLPDAERICCMLAIMRVGGIYVPLDPEWPGVRLQTVLESCSPRTVLTDSATVTAALENCPQQDNLISTDIPSSNESLPIFIEADSPAALLYTSGTTGKPKGVLLSHDGLYNNVHGTLSELGYPQLKALQQSAATFDLSLKQILIALASGGSCHVVPAEMRKDARAVANMIVSENITYTKATPSEYTSWLQAGASILPDAESWQFAFAGGEVLPHSVLHGICSLGLDHLRFFCVYGPAEVSLSSHLTEILYKGEIPDRMPIGRALPNYSTYVVDENLKLLPMGVPGELLIGGVGVCKGYYNEPDLTREQFIHDAFATPELVALGHNTLFRSGDRGRLTQDGTLCFDGRVSSSTLVKLRGFRVDLQDTENAIVEASHGAISRAVASMRGDDIGSWIVAHVAFFPDCPQSRREPCIRETMARLSVPHYMRPSMMFEIDRVPLTSHGKVDRRAIDALELPVRLKPELVQLSSEQLRLWKIWTQVLPSDAISAVAPTSETDFMDVGGNSMLLVMLQNRLREHLNLSVPLLELFEATTLGTMAGLMSGTTDNETVDWSADAEATLDVACIEDFITSTSDHAVPTPPTVGCRVAITGAFGFAGRSILQQLLEHDGVAHVHCLAVRQSAEEIASSNLISQPERVTLHHGDMIDRQFGMTDIEFALLSQSVDVIIHCAASRSFWDSYTTLKPVNVEPTKQLVRLAAPRRVPILFMSSASAASMPHDTITLDSAAGYNISKLVSELALSNAHNQFGIGFTTMRMARGEQTSAQRDFKAIKELVRIEQKLGKRIKFDELSGSIALAPVADVARAMVEEALALGSMSSQRPSSKKHVEYAATCSMTGDAYNKYAQESGLSESEEWTSLPRQDAITFMKEAKAAGFKYIVTAQEYRVGDLSSAR
jgi:hybrid polyketide synthase/nonribosomal peptide synthetase ACE1